MKTGDRSKVEVASHAAACALANNHIMLTSNEAANPKIQITKWTRSRLRASTMKGRRGRQVHRRRNEKEPSQEQREKCKIVGNTGFQVLEMLVLLVV